MPSWLIGAVAITFVVQLSIVYAAPLHPIFETETLSPLQLGVVLAASVVAFVAVEIEKWLFRRRYPAPE